MQAVNPAVTEDCFISASVYTQMMTCNFYSSTYYALQQKNFSLSNRDRKHGVAYSCCCRNSPGFEIHRNFHKKRNLFFFMRVLNQIEYCIYLCVTMRYVTEIIVTWSSHHKGYTYTIPKNRRLEGIGLISRRGENQQSVLLIRPQNAFCEKILQPSRIYYKFLK